MRDPTALSAEEHGPAGDQASEVGCDLPLSAVDPVIHHECRWRDHRADPLAIEHVGIEPADEHCRAHLVADIMSGNAGGALERTAARQGGGGDDGTTREKTDRRRHLGLACY